MGDDLVVAVHTSTAGEHEGVVGVDSDGGPAKVRVLATVEPAPPPGPEPAPATHPGAAPAATERDRPGAQQDAALPGASPAPADAAPPVATTTPAPMTPACAAEGLPVRSAVEAETVPPAARQADPPLPEAEAAASAVPGAAQPGADATLPVHSVRQRAALAMRLILRAGKPVREVMTGVVLSVGPAHTVREAARLMSAHRVGAVVVVDAERAGIGILTERDIIDSVGAGQDPDTELVAAHQTDNLVFAAPKWPLDQAAAAMVNGNFRHLIVIDGSEVTGILSMRDIMRVLAGSMAR